MPRGDEPIHPLSGAYAGVFLYVFLSLLSFFQRLAFSFSLSLSVCRCLSPSLSLSLYYTLAPGHRQSPYADQSYQAARPCEKCYKQRLCHVAHTMRSRHTRSHNSRICACSKLNWHFESKLERFGVCTLLVVAIGFTSPSDRGHCALPVMPVMLPTPCTRFFLYLVHTLVGPRQRTNLPPGPTLYDSRVAGS